MEEISGWPSATEREQQKTLATVAERLADGSFDRVTGDSNDQKK